MRSDLNDIDMQTLMFDLSVSVKLMCDAETWSVDVITDTKGTHTRGWSPRSEDSSGNLLGFPCFDMASGTFGDFVADGSVNLFDVALLSRMVRLPPISQSSINL